MDWAIHPVAKFCMRCGRAFADREKIRTVLLRHPQEGYLRRDLCESCWQEEWGRLSEKPPEFVSQWQTFFRKPAKPTEPVQRQTAEGLLRRLLLDGSEEWAPVCFVLAVMLERKRILRMKARSEQNGKRWLHYEHSKTGETLTVPDPGVQLEQMESIVAKIATLLEQGLPDGKSSEAEAIQSRTTLQEASSSSTSKMEVQSLA